MVVWEKFCIFAAEINERKGLVMKILLMILFLTIDVLLFVYVISKIRSFFRKQKEWRKKMSEKLNKQYRDDDLTWARNGAIAMMDE